MDDVAYIFIIKAASNEMEYDKDSGSLELTGVPKCIELKIENSDPEVEVPEESIIEKVGKTEENRIIKDEVGAIFKDDIVDGKVDW